MLEPVNAPGTARGLSLDVDPNPPVISNMNRNVTLGPRNYPVRARLRARRAPQPLRSVPCRIACADHGCAHMDKTCPGVRVLSPKMKIHLPLAMPLTLALA